LEALKAYGLGLAQWSKGDPAGSIPLFQHAIELDRNFATAYAALGRAHQVLGEGAAAAEAIRKAYTLSRRASERERLDITSVYYQFATGQIEQAIQSCQLWEQTYPRDFVPHRMLGYEYANLGRWEESAKEFGEANHLDPSQWLPCAGLMQDYMALNRLADAHAIYQQAQARELGSGVERGGLRYLLAFLEGDTGMMAKIAHYDETITADTEAYFGHLGKARELSRRAGGMALSEGKKETAAEIAANAAVREALYGNSPAARRDATSALRLFAGGYAEAGIALALALAGDLVGAENLERDLAKQHPDDTMTNNLTLPEIRGAIEIIRGRPAAAVDQLTPAAAYELSWVPPKLMSAYLRGQAYLAAHRGAEAATEFQKVLEHRGVVLNEPIGALAHLGLGRAYALQGDKAKSRMAYQDFLALWKDADQDIPILKEAKAEYTKLK
jgi:tetratricopeptide (TPR) repeat protein